MKIQITITNRKEQEKLITIEVSATIGKLKDIITKCEDFEQPEHKELLLTFYSKELKDDNQLLTEAGIKDGSTICVGSNRDQVMSSDDEREHDEDEHNERDLHKNERSRVSVRDIEEDDVHPTKQGKKRGIPPVVHYLGVGGVAGAAAGGVSCGILLNTTTMSSAKLSVESAGGATVVVTAVLGAIAGGIMYKAAGASRG